MDIGHLMILISLEQDHITYEEYCDEVPPELRPKEYATYTDFLRNKGKASQRIRKQSQWNWRKFLNDNDLLD